MVGQDTRIPSVAVTGALGNLGWKLMVHLAQNNMVKRLVALDAHEPDAGRAAVLVADTQAEVEFVRCDLTDWNDRGWREAIARVDAVVHFAAQNPFPEASWDDAVKSLDMVLNVAQAAADGGVRRVVFASSNHVMGRYKDREEPVGSGELRTDLEPGTGTLWHTGKKPMDSTVYAVSKIAGERACRTLGSRSGGKTTFACVRIGWCQPGENSPKTLSAAGTPTQESGAGVMDAETYERTDRWFKQMWLSNRDFTQIFERAVEVDGSTWPGGCVVVNGMSNNKGMAWSLDEARQWLGYEPVDDVYGA
ncbi:MAG: NAD(P)-dependent oxidoreductase [bacterium]|nr:NAD(P)-dependent oxidoreductase [bacterium]